MSNSFGPDEAWITPSLAGQLGISHKNLEGEWANKYTRTDIHDTALARIAELEAALTRQGDNMAFILNHMDTRQWYDKFTSELAEGRAALKAKP